MCALMLDDERTAFVAPDRTLQQRMVSLGHANEIRIARSRLKLRIRSGEEPASAVLSDPPGFVETMKVFDLLLVVPYWGRVKVLKILNACRISAVKTVGGLSARQRVELASMLRAVGR